MSTGDLWAIIGALIGAASLIATVCGVVAKSLTRIHDKLSEIQTGLTKVTTENADHEWFASEIDGHGRRLAINEAAIASLTTETAGMDKRLTHLEEYGCAQRVNHEK